MATLSGRVSTTQGESTGRIRVTTMCGFKRAAGCAILHSDSSGRRTPVSTFF
jgi:hypothetical protein